MLLAALAAQGDSVIHNIGQIERATSTSTTGCEPWGRKLKDETVRADRDVGAQHAAPLPDPRSNSPKAPPAMPPSAARVGGVGRALWGRRRINDASLSLGLWSDEPVGQVIGRWRAFRARSASAFPATVLAHQVHGTDVHWHDALPDGWLILDGVDGHATRERGVLLTVTVADCIRVPHGPREGRHRARPRGLAWDSRRHPGACVELLKWRGFAKGSDIVMHCGVGICGKCYEVGSEVAVRFGLSGTVLLDLRAILAQQARKLGIEEITVSPSCSAEERGRFFSHRASRGRDGRMVAYIGRALG